MSMTLEELVHDADELVSLPGVCMRINAMVDDPDSTAKDIGEIISQDPALTVRLLRIANSPFYGFSSEIDTVSRAVTVIGTERIRDLVLATSAIQAFEGIPNELVTMDDFWLHSIYCGISARLLANKCEKSESESLFVAGLLHDIGQLLMFHKLPQLAKEALLLSIEGPDEPEMYLAERQVFGFDHTQVGGELVRHWQLPTGIQECVEFHHEPEKATQHPLEVSLVHMANTIACLAELNTTDEESAAPIEPSAWEVTGLSKDVIASTVEAAQLKFSEVQSVFLPG